MSHAPISRRARVTVLQAMCALAGLVLGLLVPRWSLGPLLPTTPTVEVMIAAGFGVLGLVAVVFTLLLTVVQWVYGTFSQRLRLYDEHWVTWWAFGLAIGVFVYSLVASAVATAQDRVPLIVPGVGLLGLLATLVLLRQMQLLAYASVQLGPTLHSLVRHGRTTLAECYPPAGSDTAPNLVMSPPAGDEGQKVTWDDDSVYVAWVDVAALANHADQVRGHIDILVPPGRLLHRGATVAVQRGGVLSADHIRATIVTDPARTLAMDPLLPARLIADIALRALSPAVNDPATASHAIEMLGDVLVFAAGRDLRPMQMTGRAGHGSARVLLPGWQDLLDEALSDLVVCAAPLPSSARCLDRTLARVAAAAPERSETVERYRADLTSWSDFLPASATSGGDPIH